MSYSNTDTGNQAADPYKAKNEDEPGTRQKVDDLLTFVDKCKFCMLTTQIENNLLVSRAMALAGKEGNGIDLIFFSNTESGKTDDLKKSPDVNLAFVNSSGEWASVTGRASIETDSDAVHKHYSQDLKAWMGDLGDGVHDGGPNDPRICVIRVSTVTSQYAISNKTALGGLVEFAKGVATGEAPSVHKLRFISSDEVTKYRAGQV